MRNKWWRSVTAVLTFAMAAVASAAVTVSIQNAGGTPNGTPEHPNAKGWMIIEICWDLAAEDPRPWASDADAVGTEVDPWWEPDDDLGHADPDWQAMGGTTVVNGRQCQKYQIWFSSWNCEAGDEELKVEISYGPPPGYRATGTASIESC